MCIVASCLSLNQGYLKNHVDYHYTFLMAQYLNGKF